jgi:HK97 family phage prohead protease
MFNTKYSDCDFSGWATRNDLVCGDGRIIKKDAFKDNDGKKVSLVFNHNHDDPNAVLGHAFLENRDEGVYAYGYFNDTESGKTAKALVNNGDVSSLSIWANKLRQRDASNGRKEVLHGDIKELSLVLAGANPGAYIDFVMAHGDDDLDGEIEELYAGYNENIVIHASMKAIENNDSEDPKTEEKKDQSKMEEKKDQSKSEKTIGDVLETLNEEQQMAVYALIGEIAGDNNDEKEEDKTMKHNVFDTEDTQKNNVLTHSAMNEILELSKQSSIGSFRQARKVYEEQNELQHNAFDDETLGALMPEYKLIDPAEPKILYPDDTWVSSVINGVHKSPYSRVRTRRADARKAELQALGYKKGDYKKEARKIQLLGRTHDAQTVYVKDKIDRDDILDITDFDLVAYNWKILRHTLEQTLAQAILIGDGRDDLDPDKIKEDHIRPIWHDDELYCIHQDVDIAAAKQKLQGTETGQHFGDNYVYSEAIIEAALYSREKYKGSGNLTFYCTPHLLNVMLLARDLNGRRIYSSKNDLVAALNVKDIKTIEQFEGLIRTTSDSKKKKMLGLFVNLADYQLGCVKGGEITKFEDFDIDFNQHKLLLETRVSGALVEWYSAIALEEDVTNAG